MTTISRRGWLKYFRGAFCGWGRRQHLSGLCGAEERETGRHRRCLAWL